MRAVSGGGEMLLDLETGPGDIAKGKPYVIWRKEERGRGGRLGGRMREERRIWKKGR